MSIKIFISNISLNRWGIIAWSVIVFIYAIFVMYLYPVVSESSLDIVGYLEALPDAMKAALGMEGIDLSSMSFTPEVFAAVEFFSMWPLLIGIYAIFSSIGIAREMEQDTLDLLLAQPVARYKVITAKYAVFVFSALLISAFSLMGLMAGTATIETSVDLSGLSLVLVEAFLLVIAIGCFTLLCAALFLKPRQALMAGGIFLGLSYILNFIIPILPDSLAWLRNLSVFYHFQPNDIVTSGSLDGLSVAIYAVISVACFTASVLIFQRRDIVA
jgi:ABC-2 type transport system permease protein